MLKNLLQTGIQSVESANMIVQLSASIQEAYADVIIYCPEETFKYDCENLLWKNAFHNVITVFR